MRSRASELAAPWRAWRARLSLPPAALRSSVRRKLRPPARASPHRCPRNPRSGDRPGRRCGAWACRLLGAELSDNRYDPTLRCEDKLMTMPDARRIDSSISASAESIEEIRQQVRRFADGRVSPRAPPTSTAATSFRATCGPSSASSACSASRCRSAMAAPAWATSPTSSPWRRSPAPRARWVSPTARTPTSASTSFA